MKADPIQNGHCTIPRNPSALLWAGDGGGGYFWFLKEQAILTGNKVVMCSIRKAAVTGFKES